MRGPNGQSVALKADDKSYSVSMLASIIWRSEPQLEDAAQGKSFVEFVLIKGEPAILKTLYPEVQDTINRLQALVGDALKQKGMPYELGVSDGNGDGHTFSYSVRRSEPETSSTTWA